MLAREVPTFAVYVNLFCCVLDIVGVVMKGWWLYVFKNSELKMKQLMEFSSSVLLECRLNTE